MKKNLISNGKILKNIYTVDCIIGQGNFGEVYRVKHKFLGYQALKIIKHNKNQNNFTNFINESKNLLNVNHENIVRLFDANYLKYDRKKYFFLSMEFISGEDLFSHLNRKVSIEIDLALKFQKEICQGLEHMHNLKNPIIHRDLKPQNILIDFNTNTLSVKISDFGVSAMLKKNFKIATSEGTLVYMSNETLNGIADISNDIFSSGIIFYEMLTGKHPWNYNFKNVSDEEELKTQIILSRKNKPINPSFYNKKICIKLEKIILKSISNDKTQRYLSAKSFLNDLKNYDKISISIDSPNEDKKKGFKAIAGMDNLKDILKNEVIGPIKEKEVYEKYKITLPNGILLYGPPGCGKTFIAKKLSEEIDFSFFELRPSDFASTYIHGTQAKIGKLFAKAREKSPSIIFIDEIDALIPKRTDNLDHNFSSEVNEFLTQLDNCSDEKILVLGTTNRPKNIDSAALRTGRFDKKIYVPNPDLNARIELFHIYLEDRPLANDINFKLLASATNEYSASDIREITNIAARSALKNNITINFKILIDAINNLQSSLNNNMIKKYQNYSF